MNVAVYVNVSVALQTGHVEVGPSDVVAGPVELNELVGNTVDPVPDDVILASVLVGDVVELDALVGKPDVPVPEDKDVLSSVLVGDAVEL